jgi:hypothetical protein
MVLMMKRRVSDAQIGSISADRIYAENIVVVLLLLIRKAVGSKFVSYNCKQTSNDDESLQ